MNGTTSLADGKKRPRSAADLCLHVWEELYVLDDGRWHETHVCPLPKGHSEDHTCACEEVHDPVKIETERELEEERERDAEACAKLGIDPTTGKPEVIP